MCACEVNDYPVRKKYFSNPCYFKELFLLPIHPGKPSLSLTFISSSTSSFASGRQQYTGKNSIANLLQKTWKNLRTVSSSILFSSPILSKHILLPRTLSTLIFSIQMVQMVRPCNPLLETNSFYGRLQRFRRITDTVYEISSSTICHPLREGF